MGETEKIYSLRDYTRSSLVVFAGLILSQFSEFGKDIFMAWKYGASMISDSFFSAYTPVFLIYSTLLLACPIVLVPAFIKLKEQAGQKTEDSLLGELILIFTLVFLGIAFLLFIFGDKIIGAITPGLCVQAHTLSTALFRKLVWLLIPSGFIAIFAAYLRSRNKLFIPSSLKCIGNMCFIALVFCFAASSKALFTAAISIYIAQSLYLAVFVFKTKPRFSRTTLVPSKKTWQVVALFAFPIASIFLSQLVILSERFFSSLLDPGSLSIVAYTGRIYTGIVNLLGGTMMGAALPALSRLVNKNRLSETKQNVQWNIKMLAMVCLPISLFFLFMSDAMVHLLFNGGAFTFQQLDISSNVLRYYFAGLLFGALMPLSTAIFSAFHSYKIILCNSVLFLGTNLLVNALLIHGNGIIALPLARIAANLVILCFSFYMIRRTLGSFLDRTIGVFFIKMGVALVVMILVLSFIKTGLSPILFLESKTRELIFIIITGFVSFTGFFTACLILKMEEPLFFYTTLKQRIFA
ncbi:MAG: hypothetical protein GY729_14430 [Desulfobacteraceae bacterium]|nr:hypothetical protein [Desulfobacteraceae bacterium]